MPRKDAEEDVNVGGGGDEVDGGRTLKAVIRRKGLPKIQQMVDIMGEREEGELLLILLPPIPVMKSHHHRHLQPQERVRSYQVEMSRGKRKWRRRRRRRR